MPDDDHEHDELDEHIELHQLEHPHQQQYGLDHTDDQQQLDQQQLDVHQLLDDHLWNQHELLGY